MLHHELVHATLFESSLIGLLGISAGTHSAPVLAPRLERRELGSEKSICMPKKSLVLRSSKVPAIAQVDREQNRLSER